MEMGVEEEVEPFAVTDWVRPAQKVGGEQVKSSASDTIVGGKAMEKDGVIYGVKSSGKVEKN